MSNRMGRLTKGDLNANARRENILQTSRVVLLKRMWQYLGKHRLLLVLAITLAAAGNALALVGPKLSGLAIDSLGIGPEETDFSALFYYCGLMAIFYGVSSLLGFLLTRITLKLTRHTTYRMRKDVFDKLVTLPVSYFDTRQAGDIISVLSYDIDTVNESLSTDFLQILQSVITIAVSLVMMLSIQPALVIIFLFTVPLTVVYTRWVTKKTRPMFRKRSASLGELNGYMEEMIGGQKTTKAYSREAEVLAQFDIKNEEATQAFTRSEYYGTLIGPAVTFINNLSLALISVFGSLLFLQGRVGLGDISSFIQYSRKFSGPINETANILGELQSAFAAAERVFRLMDEPAEKADDPRARALSKVGGDVRMQDIHFRYLPEIPVIQGFSMDAHPGSLTAIVGPTGAGKTTLINLLMRFYDIDSGSILVDGNDIYQITRDSLRSAYTMVLQDSWLFYGTVYDNIAYGRPDATREEVEQAAKSARIHHFITRLPQGYDTVIGDDGINISKGQKQ